MCSCSLVQNEIIPVFEDICNTNLLTHVNVFIYVYVFDACIMNLKRTYVTINSSHTCNVSVFLYQNSIEIKNRSLKCSLNVIKIFFTFQKGCIQTENAVAVTEAMK